MAPALMPSTGAGMFMMMSIVVVVVVVWVGFVALVILLALR